MNKDRLVWCDIETTGLDPETCLILEVGFKITDLELNVLSEMSVLIWSPEYRKMCVESKIFPYVWNMHTKSGLWVDAPIDGVRLAEAREQISTFLEENHISTAEPLCGSSIQFDRKWLEVWMPECVELFSYRNIDISTLKELCKRYNPILYEKLNDEYQAAKQHRVLADIDDTLSEFKFYRDNFLFWKD